MREREMRLVVTFATTTQAMAMEQYCKMQGLKGRIIPVPRQIHAGCGLAWSAPAGEGEVLKASLSQSGLVWEQWQELEL